MTRLTVALLLICCVNARAADDLFSHPTPPAELAKLLEPARGAMLQSQALRGNFQQKKFLSGVPKPLASEGEFVFARDRGIWWHTQKPFDSEFVLTRDGIYQRDAGATPIHLTAQQQPALRIVADIFLALFSLDLGPLTGNFDAFGRPAGKGWMLGLAPHPGALGGVLKNVIVRGRHRVERIELEDAHGDRTELTLRDNGRGGGILTAAELASFQVP